MSEPIKLKVAGDKHTMDVKLCRLLPFGNDPETEFEGRDGSKVWMPKSSADRQLTRLNLTMETVVGRRVTLKRDPAPTGRKPYWGIYLEDGNGATAGGPVNAGTVATTQPAITAPAPAPKPEKDSALYLRMTEFVLTDVRNLYETHGYQMPADVAAACVATLFIQAKR